VLAAAEVVAAKHPLERLAVVAAAAVNASRTNFFPFLAAKL
jgi:hypothetical protein